MSDAVDLIKALIDEPGPDDMRANAVLSAALEQEIDPLLYCALVHALPPALLMERAARWAGYAFYHTVPQGLGGRVQPNRLEALAGVRMVRMTLLDREVAFAAPDFFGLLRLR